MTQWLFGIAIVAAALVCPTMMWLGRRGVGPGCAMCPPERNKEAGNQGSLEDLRARQRELSMQLEKLEAPAESKSPRLARAGD